MKLIMVSASQRAGSLSAKVARALKTTAEEQNLFDGGEIRIIDLSDYRRALWDEAPNPEFEFEANILRDAADWADAVVYIVPEWNGMAPPLAKNFFLLMDGMQIAHKPGLLVAVSAGSGGAYPIFEIRASSYKNTKICWIPEHIILRSGAVDALETGGLAHPASALRATNALQVLFHYSQALRNQRVALCTLSKSYPYGL